MGRKESSLPKDWFRKGDSDIQTVEILLEHEGEYNSKRAIIPPMNSYA